MGRLTATLAVTFSLVALSGCGNKEPAAEVSEETPQRLIVIAPSAAEAVHALGLGERVVGVGDYVKWPENLAAKPKLGGLFNPNLERIVSLRPDIAILLNSEGVLRDRLESIGVEVLSIPSDTLGDVEIAIEVVGERFGVEARAQEVLKQWRQDLAPAPLDEIVSVAVIVGREPREMGGIVVAGPETFFDQLLSRAGALNAFQGVDGRYPQVGADVILARRPDVILEVQPLEIPVSRVQALQRDWSQLLSGTGLSGACIAVIDGEHVLVPGLRLPDVYAQLRAGIESCRAAPAA